MSVCWPLRLPAVAKSVLIALADNANDQGVAWPSIATICVRTCYSERAVRNAIRTLEGLGLLRVRQSGRMSSVYTIDVIACRAHQAAIETPADPAMGPDDVAEIRAADRHEMPGEEHSTGTTRHSTGTSRRFDRHDVPPNRQGTNANTTPLPPDGGSPPFAENEEWQTSALAPLKRFRDWVSECQERGESPIREDDPVWAYADAVGLPEAFIQLQWWEFKRRHGTGGKRHRDWRAKFLATVESNAYRFWFAGVDHTFSLTTQGVQAMLAKGEA